MEHVSGTDIWYQVGDRPGRPGYLVLSAATVTYLSEASATVRCFTAAASRPQVRWVHCGLFVNVISGLAGVVRMVSLRDARQA
jgi:hypothetical protein